MSDQKVVLITGASGSIGAATSTLLASQGYIVFAHYNKNREIAEKIVNEINYSGGRSYVVQANLLDEKQIVNLFVSIQKICGLPISALVNNAGINGGTKTIDKIDFYTLETVFNLNVFGTILCCREVIKQMKIHGGGNIVNVSSQAAIFGGNQLSHYAASKAAINAFTIGSARELAIHNIRMNAVSPGIIDTPMHDEMPEEKKKNIKQSLPMGRMGTPLEVADAIAWLLSEKSSYVNGAIIPITGAR